MNHSYTNFFNIFFCNDACLKPHFMRKLDQITGFNTKRLRVVAIIDDHKGV